MLVKAMNKTNGSNIASLTHTKLTLSINDIKCVYLKIQAFHGTYVRTQTYTIYLFVKIILKL